MKTFTVASIIALASVASAQIENVPSCALSCLTGPLGSDGCSSLTDFKCHCEKSDSLFASVTPCVQKACSADDQEKTISAVEEICKQAGVPVEVPTPGASGASSAAASTPAPSSGGASTPAPSTAGGASSAASSAAASVTSAVASATGGSNATSPSTPTPSEFTGAAAQATKAAGLLGAAAIAVLAL